MSRTETPDSLKQFLAIFGQLGGIIASLVVLIQTVTGNLDSNYAETLSVLSAIVLTALLWIWRFPRIVQAKSKSGARSQVAWHTVFWDAVRNSKKSAYLFPLARRRMETGILLLMSLLSIAYAGGKTPRVIEEISGFRCSYAADENAPLIIIAELNNLTGIKTAFVDRLFTEMVSRLGGEGTVCRSGQIVVDGPGANELGRSLDRNQSATIVIWGDIDANWHFINISPLEWTALESLIVADSGDARELEDWAREYIPLILLSELKYINGEDRDAIKILDRTTQSLLTEVWAADNGEAIASLYVLLAMLFEAQGELSEAIHAYDQALMYDEEIDIAVLNKGILYLDLDPQQAFAQFDLLINKSSEYAVDAYINRASLQSTWELQKADYLSAIGLAPDDPHNYHYLGLAALFAGDYQSALIAYKDSLAYLDAETRDEFIEELNYEVQEDQSLTKPVEEIIGLLGDAELKESSQ
ncbi:MAG TPA: hypothetical protein VI524_07775 [Anaerolineales bacterium]|nr:hypothetical protein [Anaerolineales bacterium]